MKIEELMTILEKEFPELDMHFQNNTREYYYPRFTDKIVNIKYVKDNSTWTECGWFSINEKYVNVCYPEPPFYSFYTGGREFTNVVAIYEKDLKTFVGRVRNEFYLNYLEKYCKEEKRAFKEEQLKLF